MKLDRFPRYTGFEPAVPIWCLTPGEGRCLHRFFDTSPISPDGRYAAVFRMPFEDRPPKPGDAGQIVVVDLDSAEQRIVAETRGWEVQLGANLQWGGDGRTLIYNDVDVQTWRAHGVKLDWPSGETQRLDGGVYHVSPDGRRVAAANMATMRRTQSGYGVVIPDEHVPRREGLASDDGLWLTDTETGATTLLLSIRDAVEACPGIDHDEYSRGETYGFHTKWNPQGDRLIFTLRHTPPHEPFSMWPTHFEVLTLKPDGTDVRRAVPAEQWAKGGHHINWFPDGRTLSMNLNVDREGLRLMSVNHDGSDLRKIRDDVWGSGHPTVHPDGRHILTDAYAHEPLAYGDGTTPIRWIDIETGGERELIRLRTRTPQQAENGVFRVDPHPAWDPTWRYVCFNGFVDGTRRVYLADLGAMIG